MTDNTEDNTTGKQTQFDSSVIRLITVRSRGEMLVIRLCHMVPGGTEAQHGAEGLTEQRISYTIRSATSPLDPSCRLPPRQPFYPLRGAKLTSSTCSDIDVNPCVGFFSGEGYFTFSTCIKWVNLDCV